MSSTAIEGAPRLTEPQRTVFAIKSFSNSDKPLPDVLRPPFDLKPIKAASRKEVESVLEQVCCHKLSYVSTDSVNSVQVSEVTVFDALPDNLIALRLHLKGEKKPVYPRWHYGWPFNAQLELKIDEIAKSAGIYVPGEPNYPGPEDEDPNGPPEERSTYEIVATIKNVLRLTQLQLADKMPDCKPLRTKVFLKLASVQSSETPCGNISFLSVCTNYKVSDAPPALVEHVQKQLGLTTEPKWYMDAEYFGALEALAMDKYVLPPFCVES